MKVFIDQDEWYPVYSLNTTGTECEISEEQRGRWLKAFADFEQAQLEMREACDKAVRIATASEGMVVS